MVEARDLIRIGGAKQRFTLAQKTPQAGVDEARLRAYARMVLGGLDGLADENEGFIRRL